MLLIELANEYVPESHHTVAASTTGYLVACAQSYGGFLGRPATTGDLEKAIANRYVRWLAANRSPSTTRTKRSGLLMLWRYAARLELCSPPPRLVSMRNQKPTVRAWTLEEVRQLRDHCLTLRGRFAGVPKRLYFASLVAAGYETGLRLGDQLSLERIWFVPLPGGEARLTMIEAKTGKPCRRVLSAETMRLIDDSMASQPDRRLVWPLNVRRETFYDHFRRLVAGAGIRQGTYRYLRRAAGTQAEKQRPGGGRLFLGHSSEQVTRDSYLDPWQLEPEPLRVPEL